MSRSWEKVFIANILLAILLPIGLLADSSREYGQKCDLDDTAQGCGVNLRCKGEKDNGGSRCICIQGYEFVNQACRSAQVPTENSFHSKPDPETTSSEGGGSSVAAILLVPTCFIVIGALAYFGARRYKWLQRFRQFRQNRYGSVLVTRDDTDDDDPPIA